MNNLPELSTLNVVPPSYWVVPLPKDSPLPYISQTALKRVKDYIPMVSSCPYCGGRVKLVNNREIYSKSVGDWPFAFACQNCDAYCSVHADTDLPMGTLANAELRKLRSTGKQLFTELVVKLKAHRATVYATLAVAMNIPKSSCHWGWFTVEQCHQAIKIVNEELSRGR
jgi:hypothetical protein